MPTDPIPIDLCALSLPGFAPAARRAVTVFGAPAELVLLPERAARPRRPGQGRPAFAAEVARRIQDQEALWSDAEHCVTPNRYPFASQQAILWPRSPTREHGERFLLRLFTWVDALDGTALVNGIGAAASIAWAHAHVTPERLPFLDALPERAAAMAFLPAIGEVACVVKELPVSLLGVRGPAAPRAAAVAQLQLCRLTAAVSIVVQRGVTWLLPRGAETPSPWFPQALGAAELWGRWCYVDRAAFEAATAADLEAALRLAGVPVGAGADDAS